MQRTWSEWKAQKELAEINLPNPPNWDGASMPPSVKPAHPELKGGFKGPPADFRAAGRDQPTKAANVDVKGDLERAGFFVTALLNTLDALPQPWHDRFYGHAEQLDDLRHDLSQAITQ